jgi:two-component system NtrC family sensor kinase
MSTSRITLRRELLVSFSALLAGAMLILVLGLVVMLPFMDTLRYATLVLAGLIVAGLGLLFVVGSVLLRHKLVRPVERMVDDVRLMTEGGSHRVSDMPNAELQSVRESVNALADRLKRDQALLAENVASLEHTNAELIEARGQVIRAARLASVGTLAAGIAHEVGNPLGAILGYVDVARDRAVKQGQDPALLDAVREEAWRIDRIVRSLLDYARPWEQDVTSVSPNAVLERVKELLSVQGKLDHVKHEWQVPENLPKVLTLSTRLEQVLVNLLLNAIDALEGRKDARIEISAWVEPGAASSLPARRDGDPRGTDYRHRRRLAGDGEGGSIDPVFTAREVVIIRISDNGTGIPPVDLDRIFDPFFTTKPLGKGTGLGLAICARLVESMGGRIDATNGHSGGAIFTVRVPGMTEAEGEAGAAAAAAETHTLPPNRAIS